NPGRGATKCLAVWSDTSDCTAKLFLTLFFIVTCPLSPVTLSNSLSGRSSPTVSGSGSGCGLVISSCVIALWYATRQGAPTRWVSVSVLRAHFRQGAPTRWVSVSVLRAHFRGRLKPHLLSLWLAVRLRGRGRFPSTKVDDRRHAQPGAISIAGSKSLAHT